MRYIKKTIDSLEKCYSLAPLTVNGEPRLLVAAEKQDPCYLYALDGTRLETVWDEPGGVMTMAAVPGMDGTFLATQKPGSRPCRLCTGLTSFRLTGSTMCWPAP